MGKVWKVEMHATDKTFQSRKMNKTTRQSKVNPTQLDYSYIYHQEAITQFT